MAIALSGSLILSGSITVSGSIISTGTISMSGSIASASYANNATLAANSTLFNSTASTVFATTSSNTFVGNQTVTGSLIITGSQTFIGTKTITGSVFITGSKTLIGTNTVTGSMLISGSLTATGTITAQTLVVQTVTSSTVYSSGSNIFGNALANTQTFTGSVLVTGSLTIAGGSSATSYSGATIYGSTAVCSPSFISSGTICSTGNTCFGGMSIINNCLGIGTATPQFKLDIQNGSLGIYHNTNYSGGASGAQIYLGDMNFAGGGYACSAPGIGAVCSPSAGVAGDLAFYNYTGIVGCRVERMRIAGGNVGIGTTTPAAEFQVNKNCDAIIAISNCVNVTSGNRGSLAFYNCTTSTVGLIRATAVTDNVGTELQFHTRPAAGSLTQVMTLGSTGVATFACQVCSAGTFMSNVGTATSTYGFTHCGSNGYYGRFGVPNGSYMYLETNANSGVYIDSTTRTNYLGVNAGWSSGGGANQPLQVKSGVAGAGIWVESCSSDAGGYINMNGNCMAIGQSYRTSGGYNDIIFQTAGTTRMIVRCAGNVEVQTGIVSPMFMIERNSAYDDFTTGCYLNLNDTGTQGLLAKFHGQLSPLVNSGETMTWNYARMLIRMTSNGSGYDLGTACIRNATYFYNNGYFCFGNHVVVGNTMDGGRGFRWVVMPWFSCADFGSGFDVPGLALYNQCSSSPLRIGAVYLQYKT